MEDWGYHAPAVLGIGQAGGWAVSRSGHWRREEGLLALVGSEITDARSTGQPLHEVGI